MATHEPLILCCGMFRSGTTLLGRVLNAHPAISVASDPFLNFFKVLRTDIAGTIGLERSVDAPIGDYYFRRDELDLLAAVREVRLESLTNNWDKTRLWAHVRRHGQPYCPDIMDRLDEVEGATYRELLRNLLQLTATRGAEIHGVKEVWIDEFIPALARAFPGMKFIEIVRDPRAVCASKNVKPEKYPWLFLCRQWRKLAMLAWSHSMDAQLAERVLVLRYEDLVTEPEAAAHRITDFLGMLFAPAMLDSANFLDGRGDRWQQNTSYASRTSAINPASVDRWRTVLSEQQIAFIEELCGPEMSLFGYHATANERLQSAGLRLSAPRVDETDLAAWIREQYPTSLVDTAAELAKEQLRFDLLDLAPSELVKIDGRLIESAFLSRSLFEAVRPDDAAGGWPMRRSVQLAASLDERKTGS